MRLHWPRRKPNDLDAIDVLNMDDFEVGKSYKSYDMHLITFQGYDYFSSDNDKLKIFLLGVPFSFIAGVLLSKLFVNSFGMFILMSIVFGVVFFGVYCLVQMGLLSRNFYRYVKEPLLEPLLMEIEDLIYKNNPVRLLIDFNDLKHQDKLYAISNAFSLLDKNMFKMNCKELGLALKMIAPIISFRDKYEESYNKNYIKHLNDLAYKIQLEKNMNLLINAVNERISREEEAAKSYNEVSADGEQVSYIDSITDFFNDHMDRELKSDKIIKESND